MLDLVLSAEGLGRLQAAHGGERVYVPISSDCKGARSLSRLLGSDWPDLQWEYQGCRVWVPTGRPRGRKKGGGPTLAERQAAIMQEARRKSKQQVAKEHNVTVSEIYRILSRKSCAPAYSAIVQGLTSPSVNGCQIEGDGAGRELD